MAATPNLRLQAAVDAAGMSHAGLARRVNQLGGQIGLQLRYGHTAVARWLAGRRPRGVVPLLITAALADKLGRPVTLAEVGLGTSEAADLAMGLAFPNDLADTVHTAAEHWSTVNRRDFLATTAALPCAVAYTRPLARWLTAPTDPYAAHTGGPSIGDADLDRLATQADAARRMDSVLGGASPAVSTIADVLDREAVPLLSASYTDRVGRRLFALTAQLARLAGWAAYDAGQHGLAQARYVQALRYAKAAGDIPLGAYILACQSLQATWLGDPRTAVDLAQGALAGAAGHAPDRVLAMCRIAEARGHARADDRPATEAALAHADRLLDRTHGDEPDWIDFLDHSRLEADAAEAYLALADTRHVVTHTEGALHMPAAESFVRSHGLRLAVLASAHAHDRDLDAACHHARHAQRIARTVRSTRLTTYLNRLTTQLQPWNTHPAVRELLTSPA